MRFQPHLVVFDWDGTVMDSIGAIVACMEQTIRDLGLPAREPGLIRRTVGLGLGDVLEALFPGSELEDQRRLVEIYKEHWFGGYRDRVVPFSGADDVLRELQASDALLAIATGKSRRGLDRDLETTGFGSYFVATRTADDGPSKPNPSILLGLLDELGTKADRALVIGDSVLDLQMAANATVEAVAVATGASEAADLAAEKPATVLNSLGELPSWIVRRR